MERSVHPISDEIEDELAQVAREVGHLSVVLERINRGGPLLADSQEDWEASSLCASAAEKVYTGCERVMSRIAAEVDGDKIGKDEGWHRALLDRMKLPYKGRSAILTDKTHELLDKMRGFRHRERNSYAFDLDTSIVLERAHEAIEAYDGLAADVRRFLAEQPDDSHTM
jgi:hypothetical protein